MEGKGGKGREYKGRKLNRREEKEKMRNEGKGSIGNIVNGCIIS